MRQYTMKNLIEFLIKSGNTFFPFIGESQVLPLFV